jgi:hypothetical protein
VDEYNRNLKILQAASRVLYETITAEKPIIDITPIEAMEGDNFIIEHNGFKCFIHSIYDMDNEMTRLLKNIKGNEDIIIIFGLGNGRLIKLVQDKYPNVVQILVIEPMLSVFKRFLKQHSLANYASRTKVAFIVNKPSNVVGSHVGKYISINSKTAFIANINYRYVFRDYYNDMKENILRVIRVASGNLNLSRINKLWLINRFSNMRYLSSTIEDYEKYLKGNDYIIVGAGPSLEKNMHLLKEAKDKSIIIAAGTAIKILDSNGIVPHFRIALDGHKNEMKVFNQIDTSSCPIIYCTQLYYKVLTEYKGPKIHLLMKGSFMDEYIKKLIDRYKYHVDTSVSIITAAASLAIKMESRRLIFIGMDMATIGNKKYASGAGEDRETLDVISFKDFVEGKDRFGNKVFIPKEQLSVKQLLEKWAEKYKDISFIDATEGGLKKEHFIDMSLKDAIDNELEVQQGIIELNDILDNNSVIDKYLERGKKEAMMLADNMYSEALLVSDVNSRFAKKIQKLRKQRIKGYGLNRLITELKQMMDFDREYGQFDIYNHMFKIEMHTVFKGIEGAYAYHGQDKGKIAESMEKIILGKLASFTEYINIFLYICKNFKDESFENILNNNFNNNPKEKKDAVNE